MDIGSLALAFSAGLLSFLSPCVLPLIPAYISYLTGLAIDELNSDNTKKTVMYKSLGFVTGFSIIFIILGITVSSLGQFIILNKNLLRQVGGVIIIIFGLHVTGVSKIKALYREKRIIHFDKMKGLSSLLIGMAFAVGWTPCVGPVLGSILLKAASTDTIAQGTVLLIMYSLGLAVPFLLAAYTINSFSTFFRKISRFIPLISVISGILLIVMGILVFTNNLAKISGLFGQIKL